MVKWKSSCCIFRRVSESQTYLEGLIDSRWSRAGVVARPEMSDLPMAKDKIRLVSTRPSCAIRERGMKETLQSELSAALLMLLSVS